VASDDIRLKGSVREIGIIRDSDRHDSFNIAISIAIKTEGKVSYDEAERISNKYRKEYLGKDVEFLAVNIPCPYCDKVFNSDFGLKQHVLRLHPEKAEAFNQLRQKAERDIRKGKVSKAVRVLKPAKKSNGVRATKKTKVEATKKEPSAVKTQKLRTQKSVIKDIKPKKSKADAKLVRTSISNEPEKKGKQLKLL
jgi:hypothetical protein